tara:strand:- start:2530 stop:2784 length:255 start_codon:yes stop_codon:yes gene_type:complete
MEKIEMEVGKIYFLDYEGVEIVGRFLKNETTQYIFFDFLHYWSGYEAFRQNKPYCIYSGIKNIRPASDAEKMNLVRFEIEHNCI